MISTGQGLLGYNMFAYCSNNPIKYVDPLGLWTINLGISANAIFGIGGAISIGVVIDDNWNIEPQWSYSVPGVDNTVSVGIISVGVGSVIQYTKADTIYDLYGHSTSLGGTLGGPFYGGADIVSFSDASDLNATVDGFQVTVGVGAGIDAHVVESYTLPVGSSSESTFSYYSTTTTPLPPSPPSPSTSPLSPPTSNTSATKSQPASASSQTGHSKPNHRLILATIFY